jgi:hypothetical protein
MGDGEFSRVCTEYVQMWSKSMNEDRGQYVMLVKLFIFLLSVIRFVKRLAVVAFQLKVGVTRSNDFQSCKQQLVFMASKHFRCVR